MEVSCAAEVAVVGDEVFEAFADFAERGGCVEHGVALADGGNVRHGLGGVGSAGRIKGIGSESALEDLVGGVGSQTLTLYKSSLSYRLKSTLVLKSWKLS